MIVAIAATIHAAAMALTIADVIILAAATTVVVLTTAATAATIFAMVGITADVITIVADATNPVTEFCVSATGFDECNVDEKTNSVVARQFHT